ncbi:fumarylacetoacetate hydrolase [Streptomyces sp. Root369]|nr:fumarylacetoacetate hydrolase family protein [Streptomyces sp. Root369]KQV93497.1 fumarylacetoacetate hydrolase [Streptomyces sp. Root369]
MRLATQSGRAVLVIGDKALDVAEASGGAFSSDITNLYDRWTELRAWAESGVEGPLRPLDPARLGPVSPRPRQSFCIGLNYRKHAEEAGWEVPDVPMVFTKFPSSIAGPGDIVELTGPTVDWEVELVVVIGRRAHRVPEEEAWSHVAGLTVGQDISDRTTQKRPRSAPQHSLGKSHPGYSPIGPVLVTPDELSNPDALDLGCAVNGEEMQNGNSSDMVFSVSQLIAYVSDMLPMLPGDVIFTGTPSGIGSTRQPPRFLRAGDEVTSWITGIGEMSQKFIDGPGVRM